MEKEQLKVNRIYKLKKELACLFIIFIVVIVLMKIVFNKESNIVVFKNVCSLFYLFVLPGFFLTKYWSDELDFLERLIIGLPISVALVGITSYYLGILGINIKYHFIIPSFFILIGIIVAIGKNKNKFKINLASRKLS